MWVLSILLYLLGFLFENITCYAIPNGITNSAINMNAEGLLDNSRTLKKYNLSRDLDAKKSLTSHFVKPNIPNMNYAHNMKSKLDATEFFDVSNIRQLGTGIADADFRGFAVSNPLSRVNVNHKISPYSDFGNPRGDDVALGPDLCLTVRADDLKIVGAVSVAGSLPIQGSIPVNGNVQNDGKAAVNYGCGFLI